MRKKILKRRNFNLFKNNLREKFRCGLGGVLGEESASPSGVTGSDSDHQRGVSPYGSNPVRVRVILYLGLGLSVLVLSGCMNVEGRYYIYPDSSGKVKVTFVMDPTKMMGMAGGMMKGMMPGGMPGGTAGAQDPMKELEKLGIAGVSEMTTTMTIYYTDIHKLKGEGFKELIWQKEKGLYHLKMVSDLTKFQEQFAPKIPEGASEVQKQSIQMGRMVQMQMLTGIKMSFVLVMPGEIVKSNGKFKGREATWELTVKELMEKKELTFEAFSKPSSPKAESEFKKFKQELAEASRKFKEATSAFQLP